MDKDLIAFQKELKEKAFIDLTVYDANGNFLCGDGHKNEKIKASFQDIEFRCSENKSYFRFNYKSDEFIGKIDGVGEQVDKIVRLIRSLAEKSFYKGVSLSKEEFFKKILLGELSYYQINDYIQENVIEDGELCAMLISSREGRCDEVLEVLNTYTLDSEDFAIKFSDSKCVFIKYFDDSVDEYRSVNEYAEFLYRSINEETGMQVGIYIGCTVKRVSDLSISYEQASISERMSEGVNIRGHVHSFKEFSLVRMLEDLPKYKLNEYLSLLMDPKAKEIFEDQEMVLTAEEFLENSLNVSETSRVLFLHRNTLTYRLDKIEKATGLDLRKFSDALTFRIIIILKKLVG